MSDASSPSLGRRSPVSLVVKGGGPAISSPLVSTGSGSTSRTPLLVPPIQQDSKLGGLFEAWAANAALKDPGMLILPLLVPR